MGMTRTVNAKKGKGPNWPRELRTIEGGMTTCIGHD
jgi:hypothetical protein